MYHKKIISNFDKNHSKKPIAMFLLTNFILSIIKPLATLLIMILK